MRNHRKYIKKHIPYGMELDLINADNSAFRYFYIFIVNWAISWDYGTFRPPQTHSSYSHAQQSSGARCLIFGWAHRLLPYFMCANSEGSGETVRMRRLAWAFAGRLCDKYHNLMSWLVLYASCVVCLFLIHLVPFVLLSGHFWYTIVSNLLLTLYWTYPTIYIIATEIAGNYLFPWKDANWLTCSIIYMEVMGENIKNIK